MIHRTYYKQAVNNVYLKILLLNICKQILGANQHYTISEWINYGFLPLENKFTSIENNWFYVTII